MDPDRGQEPARPRRIGAHGASPTRAQLALHDAAVAAGEPGYEDPTTGLFALTAAFLAAQGRCCERGCRHCPGDSAPEDETSSPALARGLALTAT